MPILPEAATLGPLLSADKIDEAVAKVGTCTLEGVFAHFGREAVAVLPMLYTASETMQDAVESLADRAPSPRVKGGAAVLVLDDSGAFAPDTLPMDPHLALIAVDRALRETPVSDAENAQALRRMTSLVVRSGGLRNLHDIIFAIGTGADAVAPTLLLRQTVAGAPADATEDDKALRLYNLLSGLQKGLEKVISTMGTHELRGYGRIFASIGLASDVANLLEIRNFCGSSSAGLSLARLDEQARQRLEIAREEKPDQEARGHALLPESLEVRRAGRRRDGPVLGLHRARPGPGEGNADLAAPSARPAASTSGRRLPREMVSTRVKGHDMPLELSSMSFGSQGETAFRSYAEAALRLNIVCLNGEGGEIKDMYGRYRRNRGQQVASGRFGVNIDMLNASDFIEIKIGQGAKPGEGGHLPGKKVSVKVAAARHATPGVDLISPSNNHDIYSIEDLAQIIEELHTANPRAKVSVKVPVVPNIGTIALGVAKAGADIITLSGL